MVRGVIFYRRGHGGTQRTQRTQKDIKGVREFFYHRGAQRNIEGIIINNFYHRGHRGHKGIKIFLQQRKGEVLEGRRPQWRIGLKLNRTARDVPPATLKHKRTAGTPSPH